MKTLRPSFLSCVFLAVGLGLGWWLRGIWAPVETPAVEPDGTDSYSSLFRAPVEQLPPPMRQPSVSPATGSETPQSEALDATPEPTATAAPDPASQLREYLSQRAFPAAVGLYQDVDREDRIAAQGLRDIILEYLESYLRQGDDYALTALAEQFLSVHYDDIDVLLLLARHQLQSDFWAEAARTFQLVYAYSAAQPGQRDKVNQAFEIFVRRVDDQLSAERRWQSLIRFYETLDQLALQRPREQRRLAELHLEYGNEAYGRSLLDNTEPPSVSERRAEPVGSIPLEALGSHYLLPLSLAGQQNVRLVVDTGASLTTLTQSAFDRLSSEVRFTELGPQLFNTASGTTRGMVYEVESVQIGEHRLANTQVAVLDFPTPDRIDGLLGMNILSQFRFEVDQDNEMLLLQPR